MTDERSCATRRLKQARYLQRHHPEIVPTPEPSEGFETVLEGSDPSLRFALREALDASHAAPPGPRPSRELFHGSWHVVRPTISGLKVGPAVVARSDVELVRTFLAAALDPIARYAAQYGPVSVAVAPTVVEVAVASPYGRYNDTTLRGWIDAWVQAGLVPATGAALLVLNPPGTVNTDADASRGFLGYHGAASVPYGFVNLFGSPLTLDDAADRFALGVSHVVAELTIDPAAELSNPEVCDPCGSNSQTPIRGYFDASGTYLGSSAEWPPPFPHAFFVSAVARPASSTDCPAPAGACAYAPP